ncbi:hypothetical protein Tco_1013927 [Tanacetum coccineum]
MGTIDSMKSVLTQFALDSLCEKFHIPDIGHPELPGHNDRIQMDLFAFINHEDPTKVWIEEREVTEGEGAGNDDVNEEDGDAAEADQT